MVDVLIRKGLRPGHYGSLGPKVPLTYETALSRASEMQSRDHIRMMMYQCRKCFGIMGDSHSWHIGKRKMKYIRMPSEWDILELGTRVTGNLNQENSGTAREQTIKRRVRAASEDRLGVLSRPRPLW